MTQMIDGFDITPEIHYDAQGRAVLARNFCIFNGVYKAASEYGSKPGGIITEWHDAPVDHGGAWDRPVVLGEVRQADLKECNGFMLFEVLGFKQGEVEKILAREGEEAKHIHPLSN